MKRRETPMYRSSSCWVGAVVLLAVSSCDADSGGGADPSESQFSREDAGATGEAVRSGDATRPEDDAGVATARGGGLAFTEDAGGEQPSRGAQEDLATSADAGENGSLDSQGVEPSREDAGGGSSPVEVESEDAEAAAGSTDNRFGDLVSMYSSALYDPVDGVGGAVAPSTSIAVGVVEDLAEGRKEDLSEGTNDEYYVQYFNVVIRVEQLLRGFPDAEEGERVFVEFNWPQNLDSAELSEALPRGARAIILGEVPDGVQPADSVVHVPPYGLIFETRDGLTQLPFDGGRQFHEVIENYDGRTFEELVAAVTEATR